MKLSTIGKFVAVTVLVASTALVFAQGGGGGQGRGGRGGFGGQRGGMFGTGPMQLAGRADVQRDIKATDDQKTKIAELQQKQREEMMAMFQGGGGGGAGGGGGRGGFQLSPEQQAAIQKLNEKYKGELGKVLDAGQMKRLDEIQVQLAGGRAIFLPAVQKALGLSEDTVKKANDLQQKQQEANRSIMEKVMNQEISREEAQAAREKNNAALDAELAKLLTSEQAAKLKEMQGAPFKADPPQGRGGGGL
jgi:hypothetical protein